MTYGAVKMTKNELIDDLRKNILAELPLEDITEDDIQADTLLFDADEGLGFDSLDAVELVVVVEKHYGVAINDPDIAKAVFKNLDVLSDYILNNLPAK